MKLLDHQRDELFLARLGEVAVQLVKDQNYQDLANRFGYALTFGKDPADAIQEDITLCLSQAGKDASISISGKPVIQVRRFKRDDAPFIALIECRIALVNSTAFMLAELVVTTRDEEQHVTLEQISQSA